MRKICRLFTLLMLVSMCISCKTNESLKSTRIVKSELDDNKEIYSTQIIKSGLVYNPEWHKTIDETKVQAKEYWKKDCANFNYSERRISEVDLENTKTIFVETYRISVSTLLKWDTFTPVQNMMSLCIDTAVFYAFPNGHNPSQAHFAFNGGQLNGIGYFGLLVTLNQINELYFKKHLPFINVDLVEKGGYRWHLVVFIDESGELMSTRFGVITPLKEVLKSYLKPNGRIDYFR